MLKNRNVYFTATFLIGFISLLMPNQALAQYDNTFNQNNYPPIGATQSKFNRTSYTSTTNSSIRNRTLAKARQELLRRWIEARLRQTRNTR
jgi:hypothetical protein